jgi:hypothetical protein
MILLFILVCCIPPAHSSEALFIDANGDATFSGNATVKGCIRGIGLTPPGGIIMFSGDVGKAFDANGTGLPNTPYEGWQLCNGKNNSPDLQDRFIAAAGRNYKPGEQGGSDTVTLKLDQMPSHNHGGNTNRSPPLYLNYGGVRWNSKGYGKPGGIVLYMDQSGLPRNRPNQIYTGKVGPVPAVNPLTHVHPISAQGSGAPLDVRPSFYALAFIMRLPLE